MKLKNLILSALLVLAACVPAKAQFDQFGGPRVIVCPPKLITATDSNSIIDTHGFDGVATFSFITETNSGKSALTVQILQSADQTNYTALQNYALAVSNNVILTNLYYGTGTPLATNQYLFPGTVTTPSASSAGFATTYLLQAPFTNSAALTVGNGVYLIGFNVQDAQRYLQVVWTVTGGSSPTNTVSAIFTGRKQQQ